MSFQRNDGHRMALDDIEFRMTERKKEMLDKSWAKAFAEQLYPAIDEYMFSALYSNNASAPGESVKITVGALVLKELLGITDRELVESMVFDIRFQYALHMANFGEQLLSEKELTRFRSRCYTYGIATGKDLILECAVGLSSEIENLTKNHFSIFSLGPAVIASNIKRLSKLEFLYTCISNLVSCLHEHEKEELLIGFEHYYDPSDFARVIYHTNSEDTGIRMGELLSDAGRLAAFCSNGDYDRVSEYQLLLRILGEELVLGEEIRMVSPVTEYESKQEQQDTSPPSVQEPKAKDEFIKEKGSDTSPPVPVEEEGGYPNRLNRKSGYLKVVLFFLLLSAAVVIGWSRMKSKPAEAFSATQIPYDASEDISVALDKMKDGKQEAKIVTDVNTMEKVVAVTFLSTSDSRTNEKVLEVLSQYDQKATFMLAGITAAEDAEFVLKIKEKGNKIGSSGLRGEKEFGNLSQERLIENLAKTNRILYQITGEMPRILQGTSSDKSKMLLEVAFACGYEYVTESRNFLNYQSFSSYEQVLDYVKGLKWGSLITVKMSGTLDDTEYVRKVEKIETQEDTDRLLKESPKSKTEEKSEEERLLQVVGWISQALAETDYKTVYAEELSQYEDADFTMSFTDLREKNEGKLSKVYSMGGRDSEVGLTFRGISSRENLKNILRLLKESNTTATFFVTGKELEENEDSVKEIIGQGHEIGNGGLTGSDLSVMDFSKICFEIYKTDKLLKEKCGVTTTLFMPVYAKYNDLVREAASALSYNVVTYSKNPILEGKTEEEIKSYFKKGIGKGEIIHVRLDVSNEVEAVTKDVLERIKKLNYRISFLKGMIEKNVHMSASVKNMEAVSPINFDKIRRDNNGKTVETIYTVHSISQELSFTFSGISRKEVLYDVLEKMDQIQGKGTFFVTSEEIDQNKEEIRQILSRGHEVGFCLTGRSGNNFSSVYQSIISMRAKLNKEFGVQPVLARYPYMAEITGEVSEALASAGCTLVWQDISLANSKAGPDGTLETVLSNSFHAGNISARRGYIVYFRMDYYTDKELTGNLLLDIYKNRILVNSYEDGIENNGSQYKIVSVSQLRNSSGLYGYPVKEADYVDGNSIIVSGHLTGLTDDEKFGVMKERYVGNPDFSDDNVLPGFSKGELKLMDITGRFTNEKVLFLTIDDWGSDKPINQILYVLRKHGIKASFYIKTNRIQENPNLLRAIAAEGHDIGSHTDLHLPYAIYDQTKSRHEKRPFYDALSSEEVAVRREDMMLSYGKLRTVVGDVITEGKPALTKVFRPPTLAMSKNGMEAIFDLGFEYIVSGDFSSHDYDAKNPNELARELLKGIEKGDGTRYPLQNGSIVVLHMSDDSNVPSSDPDITAKALDIAIPALLQQGYRFDKISNYLSKPLGRIPVAPDAGIMEISTATVSQLSEDDKQHELLPQ